MQELETVKIVLQTACILKGYLLKTQIFFCLGGGEEGRQIFFDKSTERWCEADLALNLYLLFTNVREDTSTQLPHL